MTADLGLANRLAALEAVIERGMSAWNDAGTAVRVVRDERVYRDAYDTFEDWARERWGWSRSRAYQMIEAADAVSTMVDIPNTPAITNERQAREVAAIIKADGPERAAEILAEVAEDGPVTARAIREAARPSRVDIIAEYPALDVPDAADADVARVAEALSKIPQHERDERAENGRRWLVAKASGALDDIAKETKRAEAKAAAVRNFNTDLNVAFTSLDMLRHPERLQEAQDNWYPLVKAWTSSDLHSLADHLHEVADQWRVK